MHKNFDSPSATKMIMDLLRDFSSAKASSQCWRLLLAVWLLAGVATSRYRQCTCSDEGHTYGCVGCSHLPRKIPAGVSSLNMAENRLTHIHFISPALADIKSMYLNNNNIKSLYSWDLCPLKSLMVLDLSANNLESLDEDSIACNEHLTRLVLDDNPQLQLVALRSESLELLYLQNCGLTSFAVELLRDLPKLRGLYLRNNDALACAQVAEDLRKYRPHLKVYCDVKTTATKNSAAATATASKTPESVYHSNTKATGHVPPFGVWGVSSGGLPTQTQDSIPQKIELVAPIPVVPLIVLIIVLAVVLVVVLFRICKKSGRDVRTGVESGDGKLLEEPR